MNEEDVFGKGEEAPAFCLVNQDDSKVDLKDLKGKWAVLYFYPKDNTSGCTKEAVDFTMAKEDFSSMGAVVVGISPDPAKSHRKFIEKNDLGIELLSDPDHEVLEKFGVWKEKSMYGRRYFGVERSTFILDPEGRVVHSWRNVKVPGHVDEVKKRLSELRGQN